MEKNKIQLIIAIVIVVGFVIAAKFVYTPEDDWIRDARGVWVKHGSPAGVPNEITEQQNAIKCAFVLHVQNRRNGTDFRSLCLGRCGNYSIDVVNVPRNLKDDERESQCLDFLEGKTRGFIELDKGGNIVRIVD